MIFKLICIAIFTFTVNGQLQGCPWPGISDYMEVDGEGSLNRTFQVNETLTYRCTKGRQMPIEQKAVIVCQAKGKWSNPVPQCCRNSSWTEWDVSYENTNPLGWRKVNTTVPIFHNSTKFSLTPNSSLTNMSSISFIEIRTAHIRYVKRTYTANTTRGVLENITISGRKINRVAKVSVSNYKCEFQGFWNPDNLTGVIFSPETGIYRYSCQNMTENSQNPQINVTLESSGTLKSITVLVDGGHLCFDSYVKEADGVSSVASNGQVSCAVGLGCLLFLRSLIG